MSENMQSNLGFFFLFNRSYTQFIVNKVYLQMSMGWFEKMQAYLYISQM